MAAAFLTHLAGDRVEVRSAGSAPADSINPAVVEALKEVGIDIFSDYFTADVSALDKSFEYAIYCRSGKRSVDAATAMDEIGFSTLNLTGGIISWTEANKEITC